MSPITIVWFRRDLRTQDHAALNAAIEDGAPILPIYILDDVNAQDWKMGAASRVWLHHALQDLDHQLAGNLCLYNGDALSVIQQLCKSFEVKAVYWGRSYEPWRISRDTKVKQFLQEQDIVAKSFNTTLLWEPWEIKKKDETPYRVFTPFYRKGCLSAPPPAQPEDYAGNNKWAEPASDLSVDDLQLLPLNEPDWYTPMAQQWDISAAGADKTLDDFLENSVQDYKKGRDFPSLKSTSRLSPYLHFGQISLNTVWHRAQAAGQTKHIEKGLDCFLSEIGWREFSNSLLYYNPDLPEKPLQEKFATFPWRNDDDQFDAWKRGQTGYPIIDAGMRELWQTGYMHNRVRMIVASFLIKNLMIPWQKGEKWFWDCLFDADLANNSASWQWVAGSGADAAPYFRIFNPVTQGQKFDPDGVYIKNFVPELANLTGKFLHEPWRMSDLDQSVLKVKLGVDYPQPIVDLKVTRERALLAFKELTP